MKITLINRIQNPKRNNNLNRTYNSLHQTAPQLLAVLWSIPQPDKHALFGKSKDNADVQLSASQAQKILEELALKLKLGEVELSIKQINHNSITRRLGVKIKGKKNDFGIIWNEIIIDEHVFFKYRSANKRHDFITEQIGKLEAALELVEKPPVEPLPSFPPLRPNVSKKTNLLTPTQRIITPRSDPNSHSNTTPPEEKKSSWLKNLLNHALFHGFGAGLLSFGLVITFGAQTMFALALAAVFSVSTATISHLVKRRSHAFHESHEQLLQKTNHELAELSPDFKNAFSAGLRAQSWLGWGQSAFDTTAWKNYRAFGAGLQTTEDEQLPLLAKMNPT